MILLLGGTSDSIILANKIKHESIDIILSTATEYGKEMASKTFDGEITYGKKDQQQLKDYCISNKISLIIDATHPYANLISENAIGVSKDLDITYIRYERPILKKDYSNYIACDSYQEAGNLLDSLEGNILLTTGSKDIELILKQIKDKSRVYVRVLPQSSVIKKLENLNIRLDQIVAIKGPFSKEFNKALMQQIDCKVVVTKESGSQGKTEEKIVAAGECNIQVVLIGRPKIHYPRVFFDIDGLCSEIKKEWHK